MTAEQLGGVAAVILVAALSGYFGAPRLYARPGLGAIVLLIGAAMSLQTPLGGACFLIALVMGLLRGRMTSKSALRGVPRD